MRKLLLLLAISALLAPLATATTAGAYVPHGFIGISPQNALDAEDLELMQRSDIKSLRLPMYWPAIQHQNPSVQRPDWSDFDHNVGLAAERGIRVFPFLYGTPSWAAFKTSTDPVETAWQRWGWSTFLRDAVERYGPDGSFWEENPDLPYFPIRSWEIWNEENIVTFDHDPDPGRFAKLIRLSGQVLHDADPGSKVILGGLFGRPLQSPPNVQSGDFLSGLYRSRRVKQYFDGVALHPYVADAGAMTAEIENLRRVMRVHHDSATPIYVTELGWGSASDESRWEKGPYGQADELDRAFSLLTLQRLNWRIAGVWWFSWIDQDGACQFCDSAGLLTQSREAKPAWYRFNAWTGGDAETVPRALFPFG
jgi:hypothetical protein